MAGLGTTSGQSHRAKTKQAFPPSKCRVPQATSIFPTSFVLEIIPPFPGGAPIFAMDVELRSISESSVRVFRQDRGLETDLIRFPITGLSPGETYQYRVRAENAVGVGEFSLWSDELELPRLENNNRLSTIRRNTGRVEDNDNAKTSNSNGGALVPPAAIPSSTISNPGMSSNSMDINLPPSQRYAKEKL